MLHVHARVAAQKAHGDLLARHFQAEDGHAKALARGGCGHVQRDAGFTHAGTRTHQDQLAPMHAGQQPVQLGKARGHARHLALQSGQLFNLRVGGIQHLADMHQLLAARAAHDDIKDGFFGVA